MNTAIGLELHGVRVRIESELPLFLDYVRHALAPYEVACDGHFDIRSVLEWREGSPPRTLEGAFGGMEWERRPDRDLYVAGSLAQWLRIDDFPDLRLELAVEEEGLRLRGRYWFHLGEDGMAESLRRLRHRSRMDRLRGRRFSTLLYYLFYHPLLWWLSRAGGWQVLHGGAVSTPHGALLLAGMPGCGKSTLAVSMLANPGVRMLSDNLVLHDGERALACPELILLDDASLGRVGAGAMRLEATAERRVFDRGAHRVSDVELTPQPVAVLFHVERGQDFSFEPLDPGESAARLRAANLMAKEVRRALMMGEVLDVVAGYHRGDEAETVERLARSVPSFVLRVPPATDLARFARERILSRLDQGFARS